MSRLVQLFVSVLLPAAAVALVHGCGGSAPKDAAPADKPAIPAVTASANSAPTIGAVREVYARIGENFSLQPDAADADGDDLRFSATNLPPWASIDPYNGHISGTPGPSDEGVYEAIVIAVADASGRAATAPFSITVVGDIGTGVATLRWETPPSKLDGSPLDDLAGYRILYGRNQNDLDQSVLINDPAVTSYEFTSLTKGIWYFAVVAVNSGGLEGPPTIVATKSI